MKQLDQNDIDKFLKLSKENNVAQLLAHAPYTLNECAADKNFEEIRALIGGVELNEKLGVYLDACHVFDAGYDIVNDLE